MSLLLAAAAVRQQAAIGGGGIAYVGKGTFTTGTTTLSLAIDPGHSTGDLLVAIIGAGNDETITGPGDWTLIQQLGGAAGVDGQAGAWYRFADGSEGATEDWTIVGAFGLGGICLAYSGVSSVADTSANDQRVNTGFANYTGTLPTVASGDWVISYISTGASGVRTFTEPSGTTEIHDQGGSSGGEIMSIAHEGPVASAPSAQNWTPNGTGTFVMGPILLKA